MIAFFKNMMKGVANTRQSLVRHDEPSPPPQGKAASITDHEVLRLLTAFESHISGYNMSVRTLEREAHGQISGFIRNADGAFVRVRACRGIFTSSVWMLSVDELDLALSRQQREIIATFMNRKFVEPKVISEADFRTKMGW